MANKRTIKVRMKDQVSTGLCLGTAAVVAFPDWVIIPGVVCVLVLTTIENPKSKLWIMLKCIIIKNTSK